MEPVKLLIESAPEVQILTEGENSRNLYFRGISIQAEVNNGNRRRYPLPVAEAAVKKYCDSNMKIGSSGSNTATGELDHPEESMHKVNPDRISHRFVEVNQDGNNWITKSLILETTCGKQVRNLAEGGVTLGMSSRGFGKTTVKNGIAIVENLHLVTLADIVVNPSAPDAWQQAVYENKEWVFENGLLVEKDVEPIMDDVKTALAKYPAERRSAAIVELFKKYIETIKVD
jgi:hypothetical protein